MMDETTVEKDDFPILDVRDLKTRFYTYQGVVQALDGVSFNIRKGETFGLVGETGCGKSVTALSIMRLVPSPPGKIEDGEVLFSIPKEKWKQMKILEEKVRSHLKVLYPGRKEDGWGNLRVSFLKALKRDMGKSSLPTRDKQEIEKTIDDLIAIRRQYDLLSKDEVYMRRIRGNFISMIFQEPMSALNPVFQAGDQIAESLLLHQKDVLSKAVLRWIDHRIEYLRKPYATKGRDKLTGKHLCSRCGYEVAINDPFCKSCSSRFEKEPLGSFKILILTLNRKMYKIMSRDPNNLFLRIVSKIPILRRYEKLIYKEAIARAVEMLKAVRIPDPESVAKSYPFELSGGMAQRVMIAIALSCSPSLLIADEPTTAVDVTIQAQVLKLMKDLKERMKSSVLLITHNLGVIAETCDRVGVMYAGVMAEIGPVRSLFKDPLHPYTKGLMQSIPLITVEKDRLQIIEGNVPNLISPPSGCRFHPRCPFAMDVCKKTKPEMIEVHPDHFVACYLYNGRGIHG